MGRPGVRAWIGLLLGMAVVVPTMGATPALPEAPERAWIGEYCSRCHEAAWIGLAGGTEAGWTTRIRRMVRRGADIPPQRIVPLARYLAAALPARVRADQLAASPINISVSPVEMRPLQVWVRTSGRAGSGKGTVVASVAEEQAALLRTGQRVRAFQLRSRASMHQGQIVSVDGAQFQVMLRSAGVTGEDYLLEIVVDMGPQLSIPNEAVIEEGDRQVAYIRQASGDFVSRQIRTGRRGELYVEVLEGLRSGDQVVTFGSFFIDAEFRMKGLAESWD